MLLTFICHSNRNFTMSGKSYLIFCILGYLCIEYSFAERFTFEVPNRDKFCFHEIFEKAEKWTFKYEVTRGGNNDIEVKVKAPGGVIVYDSGKSLHGKFHYDVQPGEYELCFHNEFSMFEHKVVFFSLEPYVVKTLAEEAGKFEKLSQFNTSLNFHSKNKYPHQNRTSPYTTNANEHLVERSMGKLGRE